MEGFIKSLEKTAKGGAKALGKSVKIMESAVEKAATSVSAPRLDDGSAAAEEEARAKEEVRRAHRVTVEQNKQ